MKQAALAQFLTTCGLGLTTHRVKVQSQIGEVPFKPCKIFLGEVLSYLLSMCYSAVITLLYFPFSLVIWVLSVCYPVVVV